VSKPRRPQRGGTLKRPELYLEFADASAQLLQFEPLGLDFLIKRVLGDHAALYVRRAAAQSISIGAALVARGWNAIQAFGAGYPRN
jgi:hypothetical protein